MDSDGWGGLACILCGVFKSKLGFLSDGGGAPLLADVEEVAGASAAVFAVEVCDCAFFC